MSESKKKNLEKYRFNWLPHESSTDSSTYIICVLDPQDLLPEVLQVVEGRLGGDGVHQEEALPVLHVQVTHGRELLLWAEQRQIDMASKAQ